MKEASFVGTLVSPISPMISLICILVFFFLLRKSYGADDPHFIRCSVPKNCGDGQNITFPFFIQGSQHENYFCGQTGFPVSCKTNGQPTITIAGINYTIHQIFDQNQTIRVSNPDFSNSNTDCFSLTKNISLPGVQFELVPNQSNLFLLYNCSNNSSSLPSDLHFYTGCHGEKILALSQGDPKLGDVSNECKTRVVAPVEATYGVENNDEIRGALENGFWLKWKATTVCSLCEESGGFCGSEVDGNSSYGYRCFCADRPHRVRCKIPASVAGSNKTILAIALAISAGIGAVMVVICCIRGKFSSNKIIYFWKKESRNHQTIKAFLRNHGPIAIRRYSYSDVKKITNFFRDKLGEGGYGGVYKGKLQDGCLVAVKVLKESRGNGEEFINEVASISRTSHVNIVTLMGFCFEGSKRALIYEFMPNGSLEKFIYKENPSMGTNRQLEWITLYNIALGIARGLEYLHRGCNTRILHFDIKPHNILLDENYCPKISDFGLAKICPREKSIISILGARGTPGYIAPEVFSRNFGRISHKSDVYSYGMMIFEMVGGRRNINVEVDRTSEIFFPHWIYKRLEHNEDLGLLGLMNEEDHKCAKKMIVVSLWCIQADPSSRPPMSRVMNMLEGSLESLQVPSKPFLSSPSRSPEDSSTTRGSIQYDSEMPLNASFL
ncbi:LEAF RUST 10 DISEASE-RESISTANCE LOCUS RECEPTOR-LIKE PROTEIN KINASE-like 2.1 [Corylus avellana]|uniref:LEAF RUST 10 DISEASE-RESISTANCE LOCUS RECEPTOR-LIKE PROTEIN KINASE-like 2.1 n=1 Tax=Corylus avellana TaxID=13451 RepID=UPI00286A8D69|nr:LEAF RUST 10 DISEASE-RESISTANCE LOCUS RECEPTOR-LIKE PROTEIN KINASE-like 2.1 [Corylus avellana]